MNNKGTIINRLENYRHLIYVVIFLEFLFISDASGQFVFKDSVMNGNNFEKAAFSLWFKSDVKKIRGLIVLMPGSNGDGRSIVYDTAWQNLATRHDLALLGCYYKDKVHENMAIENYADVKNGSGQALIDVLRIFSIRSDHPELAQVPLALWGASAGGEFIIHL